MRHYVPLIGVALLLSACEGPTKSTGMMAATFFSLSGTVVAEGQPLAGAKLLVVEGVATTATTAISDSQGRYTISGLRGFVDLQAWKPGYYPAWLCCPNAFDPLGSNFKLDPGQRIAVGDTVRSGTTTGGIPRECEVQLTVVAPPPCQIFAFIPSATGVLEVELTWGDAVDLQLLVVGINGESPAPPEPRGRRVVRHSVNAGEAYEVRVLGVSSAFEFTVR